MKDVLITYATKTGTTAHAAEIIGETLREAGFQAEVRPVGEAGAPDGYRHVILGGPVNGMALHPGVAAYAAGHADALAAADVSVFMMSYVYFTGRAMWKKAIEGAFRRLPAGILPRMTGIFGGKIDRSMPGIARLIFGIRRDAPCDLRDDGAVRDWAGQWIAGAAEARGAADR